MQTIMTLAHRVSEKVVISIKQIALAVEMCLSVICAKMDPSGSLCQNRHPLSMSIYHRIGSRRISLGALAADWMQMTRG